MPDHRLIWCHGSLGLPWGSKSTALAETASELGLAMEAPDRRAEMLAALLETSDRPAILAGSSMGGYVAAAVAARFNVRGLFLPAPAFPSPATPCMSLPACRPL